MKKYYRVIIIMLMPVTMVFAQDKSDDNSYKKQLKTMFEVSGADKTYYAAIEQMFVMFKQQYTEVPNETWSELEKEFSETSINDLTDMLTPVYQQHLSPEDIKNIILFYQTPAGKKFAEKTPFIVQESMQIGQQWGEKIGKKFVERMKEKGY